MTVSNPLMPELPNAHDFVSKVGLYETFPIDFVQDRERVGNLFNFWTPIDMYCVECHGDSVFVRDKPERRNSEFNITLGVFNVKLACSRNSDHIADFLFRVDGKGITKIGQYPSVADLYSGHIKRYNKLLGVIYRELTTAVGLYAHGVGIGSFVYLRRIFERLIEEAHQEAVKTVGWDEVQYGKSRMSEKVVMLKSLLPAFLVQNNIVYGILSKGLHELSEEECKAYFKPIEQSIELILDQHLKEKEQKAKEQQTQAEISQLAAKVIS